MSRLLGILARFVGIRETPRMALATLPCGRRLNTGVGLRADENGFILPPLYCTPEHLCWKCRNA